MLPHGAGRNLARSEVAKYFTTNEYKKLMKDNHIYSPTISKSTLDESPYAYRDARFVEEYLEREGYEIYKWLKPVYNYKPKE